MESALEQLLGPYLNAEQRGLLRYERTLPPATLAALCAELRAEAVALRTLIPAPIAREPGRLGPGEGAFWPGTLLCADLSGFTPLTERFAAGGPQGIEELGDIINRLFGALLAELDHFGGVALKFGGDALTALFSAELLGEGHTTAAAAAAVAMQRAMAGFSAITAGASRFQLRLRIGVHRGSPFVVVVGDDQRRELALAGHAMGRAALLQERAAPGEVLLSAEALAAVEGARVEGRQPGYVRLVDLLDPPRLVARPALPALPAGTTIQAALGLAVQIAALRPFVPAELHRQALNPHGRAVGEFRPVSPLFVNVASFSGLLALLPGAEQVAAQAMQRYYSRAQRVIRAYGGDVNKVDVGSSGDKLLALFGAPVVHEDDPQRAAEAALDLGDALQQANQEIRSLLAEGLVESDAERLGQRELMGVVDMALRQRIGVATGLAFAGLVGSPERREYTVIGQTVNLAARLMAAAAPGQILISPATVAATREAIVVELLPPLDLKGLDAPVEASLALRRRNIPAHPKRAAAPPVGRAVELGALLGLLGGALDGTGQVALISGEPGVGKSRLASAALARAREAGALTLELSCRSYAQSAPYSLVRDLLAQLLRLPAESAADDLPFALQAAAAELAPDLAAFAPLLDALFSPDPEADASELPLLAAPAPVSRVAGYGDAWTAAEQASRRMLAQLPRADQRERRHDLIVALVLGAAQRQPLALLVDDLHWADASSREVLQRLAATVELAPVFAMLCYRTVVPPEPPPVDLPNALALHLEPLDAAGGRALLGELLGEPAPPELDPLLARAQGSPLFLEALVQHLVAGGLLRREPRGWRLLQPLERASIPATIEPILAAQLDRLDEETRELVQVAAVIGTSVHYAVLAGVYSQARQPARRLFELVRAGIFVNDPADAKSPFRFRQTLLREVAYQGITFARRRELHRRVAERIVEVFEGRLDLHAAELAHHYSQAADWPAAYAYTLRAARFSRARHALAEALAAYERAEQLADLHRVAGDPAERLRALAELADVEAQSGLYERAHARYRLLLARYATAPANFESALAAVTLRRQIGTLYEQQGMLDESLAWLTDAQDLLQPLVADLVPGHQLQTARVERGRICSAIGWAHFRRGEPDLARRWLEAALRSLEGAADAALADRARAYNRLGGVAWMLGDLEGARDYVERGLADFTALGDLLGQADAQNNLGILAEQRGGWDGAIDYYRGAVEANQRAGRRRAAAMSRLNLGAALAQSGRPAEALPALEQAAAEMSAVGDTLHECMAARWLGRALTALGRHDDAAAALRRALELARAGQLTLDQLDTFSALGELALARDDAAALAGALAEGWKLHAQIEHQSLEAGVFLRFAARAAERAGDGVRAAELHAQSRNILYEFGME